MEWSSDVAFTIDGQGYLSEDYVGNGPAVEHGQLLLLKPREEIEAYAAMVAATQPRRIVELGIYKGGSTALLAQLARPDKLVAIELRDECAPLDRFIAERGHHEVVPYYGVDQADSVALERIMAAEFTEPVDLIIDDASHLLPQTRSSFTCLFPYLRPGGAYIIEDWAWSHREIAIPPPAYEPSPPLSTFVYELLILAGRRPGIITDLHVDASKVVVRRGARPLGAEFEIADHIGSLALEVLGSR